VDRRSRRSGDGERPPQAPPGRRQPRRQRAQVHDAGHIEIRASADPDGDGIRITVADSGCGIADDHLPFIFDLYRQAPSGRAHDGCGIGLYIVRRYVEMLGGRVSCGQRARAGGRRSPCDCRAASEAMNVGQAGERGGRRSFRPGGRRCTWSGRRPPSLEQTDRELPGAVGPEFCRLAPLRLCSRHAHPRRPPSSPSLPSTSASRSTSSTRAGS
jgi:hypothetical protein